MYLRCSIPRVVHGLSLSKNPPAVFSLAGFTPATPVTISAGLDAIQFAFDNGDDWANESGGAMLLYSSRPQNRSKRFFRGPYRLAGKVLGSGVFPPASPATVTSPFPLAVGQRVFYRVIVSRLDNRLSNSQVLTGVAV
jgi:hypothetical protein